MWLTDISPNWDITSCSLSSFARKLLPTSWSTRAKVYHERLAIGPWLLDPWPCSSTFHPTQSSRLIPTRYKRHPLNVEDHTLLPLPRSTRSSHPGRLLHQLPKIARGSTLASDQLPSGTGPVQTITTHMYAFSMELRISLYETTRQLCSSRATNMIFSSRLASVCHDTSEGGMISLPALLRVEHRSRKPTLFSARST